MPISEQNNQNKSSINPILVLSNPFTNHPLCNPFSNSFGCLSGCSQLQSKNPSKTPTNLNEEKINRTQDLTRASGSSIFRREWIEEVEEEKYPEGKTIASERRINTSSSSFSSEVSSQERRTQPSVQDSTQASRSSIPSQGQEIAIDLDSWFFCSRGKLGLADLFHDELNFRVPTNENRNKAMSYMVWSLSEAIENNFRDEDFYKELSKGNLIDIEKYMLCLIRMRMTFQEIMDYPISVEGPFLDSGFFQFYLELSDSEESTLKIPEDFHKVLGCVYNKMITEQCELKIKKLAKILFVLHEETPLQLDLCKLVSDYLLPRNDIFFLGNNIVRESALLGPSMEEILAEEIEEGLEEKTS